MLIMTEPTISDVLSELQLLRREAQVGFLALQADLATVRNDVQDLRARLQTFWDAFTDFRREYDQHTHPDAA